MKEKQKIEEETTTVKDLRFWIFDIFFCWTNLLWFPPRIINGLRSSIKQSKEYFIRYSKTLKSAKRDSAAPGFLNPLLGVFYILSGVRQGCVMSGFLFLLIVDWIMRKVTRKKRSINWGLETLVDLVDLDYADDLALLSSFRSLQGKLDCALTLRRPRLWSVNANDSQPITTGDQEVETVDSFTYLGTVVDVDKGTTADISCRLRKANAAFCKLKNVWSSN